MTWPLLDSAVDGNSRTPSGVFALPLVADPHGDQPSSTVAIPAPGPGNGPVSAPRDERETPRHGHSQRSDRTPCEAGSDQLRHSGHPRICLTGRLQRILAVRDPDDVLAGDKRFGHRVADAQFDDRDRLTEFDGESLGVGEAEPATPAAPSHDTHCGSCYWRGRDGRVSASGATRPRGSGDPGRRRADHLSQKGQARSLSKMYNLR
jgi:hypothetical protein